MHLCPSPPYPISSKQDQLSIIYCITPRKPDTGLDQGHIIQTPFLDLSLQRSYFAKKEHCSSFKNRYTSGEIHLTNGIGSNILIQFY